MQSRSSCRKKSSYKHVPHADKPVHVVERRNARERRRVHAVNLAFVRLRKTIPFENKVGHMSLAAILDWLSLTLFTESFQKQRFA